VLLVSKSVLDDRSSPSGCGGRAGSRSEDDVVSTACASAAACARVLRVVKRCAGSVTSFACGACFDLCFGADLGLGSAWGFGLAAGLALGEDFVVIAGFSLDSATGFDLGSASGFDFCLGSTRGFDGGTTTVLCDLGSTTVFSSLCSTAGCVRFGFATGFGGLE
jgi:hypothetical protein